MWLLEIYLLIRYLLSRYFLLFYLVCDNFCFVYFFSVDMMEIFNVKISRDVIAAYETFLVIFPSTLLIYIATYLTVLNSGKTLQNFFVEFALVVLPMLFNITVFVRSIYQVLAVLLVISCYITFHGKHILRTTKPKDETTSKHYTFITNGRSTINLLTAIAILAVDFKIFPKRFAKTRKYGFSLMDVGVGLFIYANGVVAPKRKESFTKIMKDSIPLFVLGIGRYLVTREIKYHVAVWEYGVHWNFFITLGITKVFSSLIVKIIGESYLFIVAPLLLIVHESLLQFALADFVFGPANRKESFIAANREGIVSSLGYVALYLLSVPIGNLMKNHAGPKRDMFIKLMGLSIVLLTATLVLNYFFGTSRRLANSSYCCWSLFVGVFMMNMYYLCEMLHKNVTKSRFVPPPLIFEMINYNGLAFFLICNVLTGCVNMIFKTSRIKTFETLLILSVYLLLTCASVAVLYVRKIRLKL